MTRAAGARGSSGRHRRRCRPSAAPVFAALAAAALALSACTSPPAAGTGRAEGRASGEPPVTLAEAKRILSSVMATNNRANKSLDTKLLSSYEAGSAFTIDSAQYTAFRLAHAADDVPFEVVPLQIVLGSAKGRFFVVGRTVLLKKLPKSQLGACPSNDTLLVFQLAASGRWQIVLEPSASAGAFATLATGRGGQAPPLPASLTSAVSGVPGRVANALARYEASGSLGPFRRSDFTGACWAVPDPRAAILGAQQQGFEARELFSPSGRVVSYLLSDGKALEMFTLRFAETIVAGSGTSIYWPHDRSQPSYDLLPIGHYSRVTEAGEVEIAAFVSPSGGYELCGAYSGVTSVTGARARASAEGTAPTLLGFVRG